VESLIKLSKLGQKYEDTLCNLCVVNLGFRFLKGFVLNAANC